MMTVNGVKVTDCAFCSESEIKKYIRYVESKVDGALIELSIEPVGQDVRLSYVCVARKFERIRRITGYLVGTLDRWNNAKKAEEKERVKHV